MTASSIAASFETASAPRSLPLERKLPLLIFGILAVVLATSLGLSYYEVRRTAEVAAADRVSSLSVELAGMMQQLTSGRVAAMRKLANDPGVAAALSTPSHAVTIADIPALKLLSAGADSANPPELITPDGRPLGDVKLETAGDDQHVRDEIQAQGAPSDSGRIGKLFTARGHAAVWMTVPVRRNGELLGYIAQQRRISGNPRALKPFRDLIGSDIAFHLGNAGEPASIDISGAPIPPPASVHAFRPGVDLYSRGAGGDAIASSAAIPGTLLVVTLEAPMHTVLAGPLATMRALAVIAVLLAIVGAGFAWWFGRQLTRPLVDLTSAAEAIAQGDYSERVATSRSDEIGRLATAFNRMAERVQVSSRASAEAVDRLTKSGAKQQFLADAGQILAASLSDQSLLAGLARQCVPDLSDYCTIHVADDDGSIRRMETVHYDLAKEDAVRRLVKRYEYRIDSPGEVPAVMRNRQPLLIAHLDHSAVVAAAKDAESVALLNEVRPTSFMCVPLVARGRAFGAMSFTMTDSGRVFGHDDLALAMELSRHTAVAIDNAMIYRASLALRLEAEAASNAKSDFLAKMSHEIRTPINAMMGYAELLEMGIGGPVTETQSKQLGRIRSSGEHLTSLVDEILDLAKIEAGRMHVDPTIANAYESAEGAVALIRPSAASKGIELTTVNDSDHAAEYRGDPQRVQQILTNLLSNAVKFTAAGGSVSIRCGTGVRPDLPGRETEWTSIVVEDTGVGIARDNLDRIFHAFVQVENGYTRAHGGTGLGLTISRSLAQMMGGDIAVESALGKGSRFTLWLPSSTAPAVAI